MPPKSRGDKKRGPRKEKDDKGWQKKQKRKVCIFCKDRIDYVDFKDVGLLKKFVSERGKIRSRRVSGNCSQHQRDVATAVKNAREMALLPFSSR
jgi:small subunit ribosomal protein S18